MPTVRDQILDRLNALNPSHLELTDDSAAHRHHAGAAAHATRVGAETVAAEGTHFELTIVSPLFIGKSLLARHRMVYAQIDDLMKSRIHAMKIDARSG
jgi:BolA family transcriptional regulator, general stress-responsive regulator